LISRSNRGLPRRGAKHRIDTQPSGREITRLREQTLDQTERTIVLAGLDLNPRDLVSMTAFCPRKHERAAEQLLESCASSGIRFGTT
jgi:hypothetical protein